jgi:hypothetical protein
VPFTRVEDLTPLGGHPTLREIDVRSTPLKKLPLEKPLPALRSLEALSTQVSETDGTAFARLNPECKLALRWERKLAEALDRADRLRVRSGGTCHRNIPAERTLYEEKDPAKVRDFIRRIHLDEGKSGFHCMCCGEPSLEFYKDGNLILTLGYHHGNSLRWVEGWPADGMMTAACAEDLRRWLADRVPEIKKGQEAERAYRKREAEETERFLRPFPEKVRPWVLAGSGDVVRGDPALGQRLAAALGGEPAVVVATCRALGTLQELRAGWTGTTGKERSVLAAVKKVSGAKFQQALEELKDDCPGLLGAARLFFFEGFGERLSPEVRLKWTVRLAEIALQEGYDENKPMVLRCLSRCGDDGTQTLLHEVLDGRKGTEMTKPDFDEPGVRAGAALALARRAVKDIKPDVEKLLAQSTSKADTAACQVALALLGDPGQLRAEQFKLHSGSTGFGAIRAVEQFGGAYGLDLLIEHGPYHPWGAVREEAELALQRITGQQWPRDDRDAAIKAWWKAQGPAFVEQRRKERQPKP